MSKLRVYELAEQIGLTSDQLVARLKRLGITVKSNLGTVDESVASSLLKASNALRASATKEAAKEAVRERVKTVSKKKTKSTQSASLRKAARKARAEKTRQFTAEYEKTEAEDIARREADRKREEEKKKQRQLAEEKKRLALEEEKKRIEAEAQRRRQAEAEARRAQQEAMRKRAAEESARRQLEEEEATAERERAAKESAQEAARGPQATAPAGAIHPAPSAFTPGRPRPRGGGRPPGGGMRPFSRGRRKKKKARRVKPAVPSVAPLLIKPEGPARDIVLTEGVTVKELSERMEVKARDVLRALIHRGMMVTINQPLDTEVAQQVAQDFNCNAEIISFEEDIVRDTLKGDAVMSGKNICVRPPVVTIMGHVDHGKTSLLDAIRKSNIMEGEAGGITQHIGAYHVEIGERQVVFVDTPGHEAFTLMRSRGAQVTDIVVLVVAADDGVKPQTREAVDHARAAGVPLVVAMNKMDKPGANPDQVKQQLSELDLVPEDWGGQTVFVPVSAKQHTGLDQLLEMILLVADMAELKADPTVPASAVVLEARLDRAKGPIASILMKNGTLRVGDAFIAGMMSGKVRALFDDQGERIQEAGPSMPVEVTGLDGVPQAGDLFQVVDEARRARHIGNQRQAKSREEQARRISRPSLEGLFDQLREGQVKQLPLILKCDVQGSVEVLAKTLSDLATEKVKVRMLHAGVGGITENDVLLASSSQAIIIGFNVRPERSAAVLAEEEGVEIRLHNIIYKVSQEIENAMVGLLDPTLKEEFLGRVDVRETFKVPKAGTIAGCYVTDGKVPSGAEVRLLRDSVVVYEGKISSLRRFKEDTSEVREGFECGIALERFQDIKKGDVIEAFRIEKIAAQSLS